MLGLLEISKDSLEALLAEIILLYKSLLETPTAGIPWVSFFYGKGADTRLKIEEVNCVGFSEQEPACTTEQCADSRM